MFSSDMLICDSYGLCVSVSQKLIKQQRFIFISQIKIYIFVVSDRKYNM